jgi:hypothetical protein
MSIKQITRREVEYPSLFTAKNPRSIQIVRGFRPLKITEWEAVCRVQVGVWEVEMAEDQYIKSLVINSQIVYLTRQGY